MTNTIAIGADHAGFELKQQIIAYLKSKDRDVIDKGTFSADRADYPDYGHAVAKAILDGEAGFGILMCGSGNGISMSANRHQGVRAALCWMEEIAAMARKHNDANILVLPSRYISKEEAFKCTDAFLREKFEGGRHQDRIEKIEMC
jgi:ribose 5-phosphate isomerase B